MRKSVNPRLAKLSVASIVSLSVFAITSNAFAVGIHTPHVKPLVVRGTVVSQNAPRHTLVVALPSGAVDTLRLASHRRVVAGTRVLAHVSKLGDGTFRVSHLSTFAKSRSVHLRATVVASHGRLLELSGGGSVFAVSRAGVVAHSLSSAPRPGEKVNVMAHFQNGSVAATSVQSVGVSNLIDLQGTLASLSSTSLTINVNQGAITTVSIPASITLPSSIVVGNQVELLVDYSNQSFSLVTITNDQTASTSTTTGVTQTNQSSNLEIDGLVTTANATSLTIQPGDNAASVTVAIPPTVTLATAPSVGDHVHVVASLIAGVVTLSSLTVQAPEGGDQATTTNVQGEVASVTSSLLVVQPRDQASPVSFTVPSTVDVSSIVVGDQINASGTVSGTTLTLVKFAVSAPQGGDQSTNIETHGSVVSVTSSLLVVQPNDPTAPPISFTVPSAVDVSSIAVGDQIDASGTMSGTANTLVKFDVQTSDGGSSAETAVHGSVVSITSSLLVVQPNTHDSDSSPTGTMPPVNTVSFVVPSTVDVSSIVVGDQISASGVTSGTTLTLSNFEILSPPFPIQPVLVTVHGSVISVSSSLLVVQSNIQVGSVGVAQPAPMNFVVPSTVDVSSIVVGDQISASGSDSGTGLTLVSFAILSPPTSGGQPTATTIIGSVISVSSSLLVVQPVVGPFPMKQSPVTIAQPAPVSFVVPSTVDVSSIAVGDQIMASGMTNGTTTTLAKFYVLSPPSTGTSTGGTGPTGVITMSGSPTNIG